MNPLKESKEELFLDLAEAYHIDTGATVLNIPLFITTVLAGTGFPSPAEDYVELQIDLNKYLVKRESATFVLRVYGYSMIGVGLMNGALIVVDRSIKASEGKIVVATINGENTVKIFTKVNNQIVLMPANERFKPMPISSDMDFRIWGVVTFIINEV